VNMYCSMIVAGILLATSVAVPTDAAPPVNRKAAGDYSTPFWGNSAGRSIRHARDYASGYRQYARQAPSIEKRMAQHEADGLGHNIKAAQSQYSEIRKTTTDKETLAALDLIEKHLTDAVKAHAQMDEMCKMDMVDGEGTMKCCEDADAALDKAMAEHEKLMKKLAPTTHVH
jgi:hypothetical protein